MKPPHIETIELSAEDIERGQREELYSKIVMAYRTGDITTDEWDKFMADEQFLDWIAGL